MRTARTRSRSPGRDRASRRESISFGDERRLGHGRWALAPRADFLQRGPDVTVRHLVPMISGISRPQFLGTYAIPRLADGHGARLHPGGPGGVLRRAPDARITGSGSRGGRRADWAPVGSRTSRAATGSSGATSASASGGGRASAAGSSSCARRSPGARSDQAHLDGPGDERTLAERLSKAGIKVPQPGRGRSTVTLEKQLAAMTVAQPIRPGARNPDWRSLLAGQPQRPLPLRPGDMDYHADRFPDFSAIAYWDERAAPRSPFHPRRGRPAATRPSSHSGLTFGGFIIRRELRRSGPRLHRCAARSLRDGVQPSSGVRSATIPRDLYLGGGRYRLMEARVYPLGRDEI